MASAEAARERRQAEGPAGGVIRTAAVRLGKQAGEEIVPLTRLLMLPVLSPLRTGYVGTAELPDS